MPSRSPAVLRVAPCTSFVDQGVDERPLRTGRATRGRLPPPKCAVSAHTTASGLAEVLLDSTTTTLDAVNTTAGTMSARKGGAQGRQKTIRQLWVRHERSRAALIDEAQSAWNNLVNHEAWSRSATAAFLQHGQQQAAQQARKLEATAVWSLYLAEGALRRVEATEETARHRLMRLQDDERCTVSVLCSNEGRVVWARHRLQGLVAAERWRRAFVYAEEVRDAFALSIVGYEPGYLAPPGADEAGEGNVSGAANASLSPREQIDFLNDVCCPFAVAEECPFLPAVARLQLRRMEDSPLTETRTGAAVRKKGTPWESAQVTLQLAMRAALQRPHFHYSTSAILGPASGVATKLH